MTDDRSETAQLDTILTSLRDAGVLPSDADTSVIPLGGGVSNSVLRVTWDGECVVVKRPRANLAVDANWPADTSRVHNEVEALRTYRDVIDQTGLQTHVPRVLWESHRERAIAIECAPDTLRMWKDHLLDGDVDPSIAQRLGTVLGTVQRVTAADDGLADTFASVRAFDQLRLDPYHRTVAAQHEDLASVILAEVERISGVGRTLVHGDFSPKNVLVENAPNPIPWLLDFEVAHWGDPAFDPAFMLNHLLIKSVYKHEHNQSYVHAVERFWAAYRTTVPWDVESEMVSELAILMLARIDGKSPVEYVGEGPVAMALRRIARRAITDELCELASFIELVDEEVTSL